MYEEIACREDFDFLQFSSISDRVIFRLEGRVGERRALKEQPTRQMCSLTVSYSVLMKESEFGRITVPISYQNTAAWGIGEEELFFWSMYNTPRLMPPVLRPLDSFMTDDEDEESYLFVLSNKSGCYGAGCIFYPGVLEQAAEKIGDSVWLLPSSVHEMILLPQMLTWDKESLRSMVREINSGFVSDDEVLSDEVMFYDKERKMLIP